MKAIEFQLAVTGRFRNRSESGLAVQDWSLRAMILTVYTTRPLEVAHVAPVMHKRPTIGLLIETSTAYGRGVLRGVESYNRKHGAWDVLIPERSRGNQPWRSLHNWDGQGIIARVESLAVAKTLQDLSVPVVNVSTPRLIPEMPSVDTDDQVVARMAFDQCTSRGFATWHTAESLARSGPIRGAIFLSNAHDVRGWTATLLSRADAEVGRRA